MPRLGAMPDAEAGELDLGRLGDSELTSQLWGLKELDFTRVYCAGRIREGPAGQGWRLYGEQVTMELHLDERTATFKRADRKDIVLHDLPARVIPVVKLTKAKARASVSQPVSQSVSQLARYVENIRK